MLKPAVGSCQGKGVVKIDIKNQETANIIKSAGSDFIIQEVVKQHPFLASLNESSINECRVTTLYVNGSFSMDVVVKAGKKGANRNNWEFSYWVGLNENGVFKKYGYDKHLGKHVKSDTGIVFEGLQYPFFDKLKSYVEKYHKKYFPQCGIVGWDILIDENEDVKVIEVNLSSPGINGTQVCNGPFFKDAFQEILKVQNL